MKKEGEEEQNVHLLFLALVLLSPGNGSFSDMCQLAGTRASAVACRNAFFGLCDDGRSVPPTLGDGVEEWPQRESSITRGVCPLHFPAFSVYIF